MPSYRALKFIIWFWILSRFDFLGGFCWRLSETRVAVAFANKKNPNVRITPHVSRVNKCEIHTHTVVNIVLELSIMCDCNYYYAERVNKMSHSTTITTTAPQSHPSIQYRMPLWKLTYTSWKFQKLPSKQWKCMFSFIWTNNMITIPKWHEHGRQHGQKWLKNKRINKHTHTKIRRNSENAVGKPT